MSFFQGTLQEGIATAVQQAKSVVCFVTDNEAESMLWEGDFLVDDAVAPLLQSDAVVLRLAAGSQEEGFLTQLYPIPKKPTLVIIKNSELKEYVAAGVSKDDFVRRVRNVLQPAPTSPESGQLQLASPPVAASAVPQTQPSPVVESTTSSSSGAATPPSSNESRIQSLLAERAVRLAAQKKKDEEEAKKRRLEKTEAQAKAPPTAQSTHADQLKKKQREAREERQRILRAIEDDKTARRARQAEIQAARRSSTDTTSTEKPTEAAPFAPASPLYSTSGHLSEHCALQVRLPDGSTIRSRFSARDALRDVRQWVDENRTDGSKAPYLFKILLTPLPSKTVDVTEEEKPLQELGLTPSATLILLPVRKFKKAYSAGTGSSGGENVFSRFLAYILAIISRVFGLISTFFTTLFSTAGPPTPADAGGPAAAAAGRRSQERGEATGRDSSRITALRNRDERRNDQQFYNGNSTNFEPRRDDEDE
ncbi:ubiquitin-related domain-containing protein [Lasiosphaeris hirsuta]|uniref:UBX domain-containing protein 2 n=1 Tax=Lasiosphaeris hirsuta TaxID=260670 RepID=A0AA40B8T3_9PEZI|nr:ubiquitin-related domain-containing protein [Lasiosphaeris hirsuta]